jgi:hypothetical protein
MSKFNNLDRMRQQLEDNGINTYTFDEARLIHEYDVWFLANVNAQIHTTESRQIGISLAKKTIITRKPA